MEARLLLVVLGKLKELYERLLKLAALQHEYIQNEQTDELLGLLTQRETVVEQITKLEAALRPTRQDWPTVSAGLSDADRARAEELLTTCRALLAQITAADNDDALVLQQRKLRVGQQLRATRTGVQVNQRYAASAYSNPVQRINVSQ